MLKKQPNNQNQTQNNRQTAGEIFSGLTPGVPSGGSGGSVAVPRPGANAGTRITGGGVFGPGRGQATFGPAGQPKPESNQLSFNKPAPSEFNQSTPIYYDEPAYDYADDFDRVGKPLDRVNEPLGPIRDKPINLNDLPDGKNGKPMRA